MKKLSKEQMKMVIGGDDQTGEIGGGGDLNNCASDCGGACSYTCPGSKTVYTGGKCGWTHGTTCTCAYAC